MTGDPRDEAIAELRKQVETLQRDLDRSRRDKDYLERLKEQGDELRLRVIDELDESRAALQRSKDELEAHIEGRTRELRREILERTEAEERLRQRNTELSAMRDAAEAANRAKTAFLAKMSHELRTPLNAIIGYSELLREEAADKDAAASILPDLDKINQAAQQLISVISDVLDLAKIESGRAEVHLEDFDLPELVRAVEGMILPLARRNGNTLQVTVAAGLARVRCDRAKLRQVLLNLLGNACKFTRDGRISLDVRHEPRDDVDWLMLAVRDTGIGIAQDKLATLFDAFTQADASTASHYGGSGLGLAISREFCRMLGGDIEVTSEPGRGSTFTIALPVTLLASPEERAAKAPDAAARKRRGGTVLVIDDDRTTYELLRRVIERSGYRVHVAASGAEGLRLAEEVRPDIITLDVKMGDMDGWSVLAVLKGDSELSSIPVIMVSMFTDPALARSLGAQGYLTKPIDRASLLEMLSRYCAPAVAK